MPAFCPQTVQVSAQLLGGATFLLGGKSSFFVAGAGPVLVKHLQTALAHMPALTETIPQEKWEKN